MSCDKCRWFNKKGFVVGFGDCVFYRFVCSSGHKVVCEHYEEYEQRPQWIPCSKRLPEQCENVLAWIERDAWLDGNDYPTRKQEAAIGFHVGGRWCFDGYAGSTTKCLAWMPLSKPYEEEGEKNDCSKT